HEPQSPTPMSTTSHRCASSSSVAGGIGSVMLVFRVRTTSAMPCSAASRSPTASRNCSAFFFGFATRPTTSPSSRSGRAARRGPVASAGGRPVGSIIASNIGCLSGSVGGQHGLVPRDDEPLRPVDDEVEQAAEGGEQEDHREQLGRVEGVEAHDDEVAQPLAAAEELP